MKESLQRFFLDILIETIPEIRNSLINELDKNQMILRDQKERIEAQLALLKKELKNVRESMNNHSFDYTHIDKNRVFNLVSEVSETTLIPIRTHNIQLSCSDFMFDSPDRELNISDRTIIISSIVNAFNMLFGMKLTIPSLIEVENHTQTGNEVQLAHVIHEEQHERTIHVENILIREKHDCVLQKISFNEVCSIMNVKKHFVVDFIDIFIFKFDEWIGVHRWKLIYKASTDGFATYSFHSKCDNKGPTLSSIQANGYLFGGYTPLSWSSSLSWGMMLQIAVLFSLSPTLIPFHQPNTLVPIHENPFIIFRVGAQFSTSLTFIFVMMQIPKPGVVLIFQLPILIRLGKAI